MLPHWSLSTFDFEIARMENLSSSSPILLKIYVLVPIEHSDWQVAQHQHCDGMLAAETRETEFMVRYLLAPGDGGGEGTDMNYPELPRSQNVQLTQRGVRRYSATYGRGGIRWQRKRLWLECPAMFGRRILKHRSTCGSGCQKKTQPRVFGTYATCVVHSMVRSMVIRGNEIRDAIQRRRMSCEKWATLEILPMSLLMW